jgi:hypothetical protein
MIDFRMSIRIVLMIGLRMNMRNTIYQEVEEEVKSHAYKLKVPVITQNPLSSVLVGRAAAGLA